MTVAAPALSVSELTARLKSELEGGFPRVAVSGEITNLTRAASGHVYFTLKDAGATLRCVMFRGFALRLKFDPRDGLEVVAVGGLTVYPARGEYQLIAQELTPKGLGAAELALRQLKEKLLRRGYFDPARKRPLPAYPKRLALVASPTGAAIRDMLEILATRWPLADVVVRPSRVQGDGAAQEVAASVRMLNAVHLRPGLTLDAIVLGRGGGSSEDLAAFNTEAVAQAVYESAVPVVSAIGHEVDVSLADLVADYRALTPSQAIAALTPDCRQLGDDLREWQLRLREAVAQRFAIARERVDRLAERTPFRKPLERVRDKEQDLDQTAARLRRAAAVAVTRHGERLAALADQLDSLSPLNVLARGYSLTHAADGKLVRTVAGVAPHQRLVTRLPDGEVESEVVRVTPVPSPG